MADFIIVTGDQTQQLVAEPMALGTVLTTVPNLRSWQNGGVILAGMKTLGDQHGYAIAYYTKPQEGAATLQSGFGIGSTVHIAPLSNGTNSLWSFLLSANGGFYRLVPWNALSMALTWSPAGGAPTMAIYSDSNPYQHWQLVEFDPLNQITLRISNMSWTATGLTLSFAGGVFLPNASHNLYVVNYNGPFPVVLPGLTSIQADQNGNLVQNSVTIPFPPVPPQGFVIFILENEGGTGEATGVVQGMTALTTNYFVPPPPPPWPYPK